MSKRARPSDEVIYEVLDGEAILLHLPSGIYHSLNETGTRLWELLEKEKELDDVVSSMLEEFDTSEDELRRDLTELIEELRQKGLVQIEEE